MSTVAAVLVTRDSERWIAQTLASVLSQSRQPDVIVVVDDHSTDGTPELVRAALGEHGRVVASTSSATDRSTRIAQNFHQGLHEVALCDIAILGDHDDIWHPNRIGHQVGIMETWRDDAMLASNGRLVDAEGHLIGGTLREAFPVPIDWDASSAAQRMRAVVRYSVATGGASAVRPGAFVGEKIPDGWLHDRWWSLVAASREALRLDQECVIDYRVTPEQAIGLDRGRQDQAGLQRLLGAMRRSGDTLGRIRDIHGLTAGATRATATALTRTAIVSALR